MLRKNAGFILLTLLIFMQIFSLLGFYGLINTSMIMKSNQHAWQRQLHLFKAMMAEQQVENEWIIHSKACLIPILPSDRLVANPLSWWQRHGCHGKLSDFRYYYVVESLGKDVCGLINKLDKTHVVIADYYRVTLIMLMPHDERILLQSTLIKGVEDTFSCSRSLHWVSPGQQAGYQLV